MSTDWLDGVNAVMRLTRGWWFQMGCEAAPLFPVVRQLFASKRLHSPA